MLYLACVSVVGGRSVRVRSSTSILLVVFGNITHSKLPTDTSGTLFVFTVTVFLNGHVLHLSKIGTEASALLDGYCLSRGHHT